MGNVGKLSVNSMLTVSTNLHAWRLHVNMYNLSDFVCCIPRMKQEFRASFHQLIKFPTNIDMQTQLYGAFASMCSWFQNESPTHTFAVDWDNRHVTWTESRHVISMGPRQPEVPGEAVGHCELWKSISSGWLAGGCVHRRYTSQVKPGIRCMWVVEPGVSCIQVVQCHQCHPRSFTWQVWCLWLCVSSKYDITWGSSGIWTLQSNTVCHIDNKYRYCIGHQSSGWDNSSRWDTTSS